MASKGEGHVYVAGRVRPAGELNGKSGNLNNVLNQLYGTNPVPGNEILCILDADMVRKPRGPCVWGGHPSDSNSKQHSI